MDQHPIPQNVTGFQFKLIGAMTVKQFGYVAMGVIAAVIAYYLPLKGLFAILLKTILIPLFGASGAIIAFVPVEGRPVDVMAGNFLKALFSPNQYIYRKGEKKFSFLNIAPVKTTQESQKSTKPSSTPKQKMINERGRELQQLLIKSSERKIKNPQDAKEADFLKTFMSLPIQPVVQMPTLPKTHLIPTPVSPAPAFKPVPIQPTPKPLAQPAPVKKPDNYEELSKKETVLKEQLEEVKKEEAAPHDPQELSVAHQKARELEKQVEEIHMQKQLLEQEIVKLKNQLTTQKTQVPVPVIAQAPKPIAAPLPKTASTHVKTMAKESNKTAGILVSDTPNVVTGMVKDARGNVLPNILVEIKDKAGNPVRAFKTNELGNFASATPLTAGSYTITLEDTKKQHTFDAIQITATNQIMLPIEIISYDKREALRKELFS